MSKKPRRSFKVGTETWTLHTFDELDGLCAYMHPQREVYIDKALSRRKAELAVLHEVIHAANPHLPEGEVEIISEAQAAALRVWEQMRKFRET